METKDREAFGAIAVAVRPVGPAYLRPELEATLAALEQQILAAR